MQVRLSHRRVIVPLIIAGFILVVGLLFATSFGDLLIGTLFGNPVRATAFIVLSLPLLLIIFVSGKTGMPFAVLALSGAAAAHLFLGDLDIGAVSIRIYIMVLLVLLTAVDSLRYRRGIFRIPLARDLAIIYAIFIIWSTWARIAHGGQISQTLIGVSSTHLFALASFVVVQSKVTTRRHISFFAGVLALTALSSAIVAIFQWFGVDQFWRLALLLRPGQEEVLLGTRLGSYGFAPGLSLFSIPFGYHLITLGLFFYSWAFYTLNARRSHIILGVVLVCIIFFGGIISQSRSAILAAILAVLIWPLLWRYVQRYGHRLRPVRSRRGMILTVLALSTLVFGVIQMSRFYISTPQAGGGGYKLTRMFNLSDPRRQAIAASAIILTLDSPLIGSSPDEYNRFVSDRRPEGEVIVSPHNMFLNALTFTGLPGFLLLVLILHGLLKLTRGVIRVLENDLSIRWVAIGSLLGLFAYLVNSQFHNQGIGSGDPMPWWLIGLMISIVALYREGRNRELIVQHEGSTDYSSNGNT